MSVLETTMELMGVFYIANSMDLVLGLFLFCIGKFVRHDGGWGMRRDRRTREYAYKITL
jgi:hypothetical protein